jgi:hypothetical protein
MWLWVAEFTTISHIRNLEDRSAVSLVWNLLPQASLDSEESTWNHQACTPHIQELIMTQNSPPHSWITLIFSWCTWGKSLQSLNVSLFMSLPRRKPVKHLSECVCVLPNDISPLFLCLFLAVKQSMSTTILTRTFKLSGKEWSWWLIDAALPWGG